MLSNLKYRLKTILYSLRKIRRWVPILWKDRDWDYFYIYEILKQKLIDTENYIKVDGKHYHADRDAQKIRTAIRLIEAVQTEKYITEYFDSVETSWTGKGIDEAYNKDKKAKRILFKFLEQNIEQWWD